MTETIRLMSRRMALWATALAAVFAARPAQAAAAVSPHDIDAMLDGFVVEQLSKRFGVLCTRLGSPEKAKADEATADFADAVDITYRARQHAFEVLRKHHQRGN